MKRLYQYRGVLFFSICCAFLLLSCEKVSDNKLTNLWVQVNLEYAYNGGPFEPHSFSPCTDDNIYRYGKDGFFEIIQGVELCGDGKPTTGTWRLEGNTIYHTYDGFIGEYSSEIIELNNKKLVTIHYAIEDDPTHAYRTTFEKF